MAAPAGVAGGCCGSGSPCWADALGTSSCSVRRGTDGAERKGVDRVCAACCSRWLVCCAWLGEEGRGKEGEGLERVGPVGDRCQQTT